MKSTIKSYSLSIIFILLSTFIFSLILTILQQNKLLSYNTEDIITNILSLTIFFISGLLLGLKQKSKGLVNGTILALIYLCINLIIGFNFNLKFVLRILFIIIGTIIGVNLKK